MPQIKKTKKSPLKKRHTHYHADGSVWAKGYIQNGTMEGYWEWFRKPVRPGGGVGTKMRSGNFEKGKQVGAWTTYDKKGRVVKVTQMKNKNEK